MKWVALGVLCAAILLAGCGSSDSDQVNDALKKVGEGGARADAANEKIKAAQRTQEKARQRLCAIASGTGVSQAALQAQLDQTVRQMGRAAPPPIRC